jgi:hypothetical protein
MGDRLFELCDAIEAVMEANPTGSWTPSLMGRSIHAETNETRSALNYMVASVDKVDCDDRGAWTRYFALSTDARARKLYHS